ncbi:hypothetical protein BpHYR1_051671 [Brachionus plicatilis]|uniref:Uncharacterized protein n=1 Tax=Brachionus plicatilis TaxID=10195 RepID=A0A3M7P8Q1_BRAPC|nr:hypothetical protein BpHYR1_051671 [Brachionus plicatilis]
MKNCVKISKQTKDRFKKINDKVVNLIDTLFEKNCFKTQSFSTTKDAKKKFTYVSLFSLEPLDLMIERNGGGVLCFNCFFFIKIRSPGFHMKAGHMNS